MRRIARRLLVVMAVALAGLAWLLPPAPAAADSAPDGEGFASIFDGKSLEGWDGNPDFWRVEDGTITGQTTAEKPTKGNTFIIWRRGELGDFELKIDFKLTNHNSGVQYRSFEVPGAKWVVGGYQADCDGDNRYTGAIYGEKFRGMLANRGQKTVIGDNHKPTVVGSVGDSDKLKSHIKAGEWNHYHIIARGFHFEQKINGVTMSEMTDEDNDQRRAAGILALQLHAGPPMKVQFRNIRLKQLALPGGQHSSNGGLQLKKIAFVAGKRATVSASTNIGPARYCWPRR